MIESDWVKICPFLAVTPPHPLASEYDDSVKKVRDIYSFFASRKPEAPIEAFLEHYSRLARIPNISETKLQQVYNSVNMLKITSHTSKIKAEKKRIEKILNS